MSTLASDLLMAADPVTMARRCGMEPDPWQARVLCSPARQVLLNVSRQAGKSTVTSIKALHRAVYRPGSLVICLSPSERQSGEFFRKVKDGFRALGRPISAERENLLELELTNGSRIAALPGKEGTIRGFSGVSLLVIDEASRVEDALYRAVRPMLATSGGELVALSTPAGKRGWWWEEWEKGGPSWERVEVPAWECPRIPAAFLEEERRALGPFFMQEYGCQFLDAENAVFAEEYIRAAIEAGAGEEAWF